MGFFTVAYSIAILFILIGAGFLCMKGGILTRAGISGITSFVVNVTLPALILQSMQVPVTDAMLAQLAPFLLVLVAFYAVSFAAAFLVPKISGTSSDLETGVIRFMMIFSNLGFMGFPVSAAVFGPESLFYVSIFNMTFSLLVFSVGVILLRPDMGRYLDKKLFLNPGIVASGVGLGLFLTGARIPGPFADALDLLGSVTSPLAMIIVGALLATLPAERLFTDRAVWTVASFRLLVIPVALYLVLSPFIDDPLLLGVPVLLAAMPAAANTVMLAEEYHVDSALASRGVFLTTMLCIVTIPLITTLLI